MKVETEGIRYRGNRVSNFEGKQYNKAVFEGKDLEDIEISVLEPLNVPVGSVVKLRGDLKTGKFPKFRIESFEVTK
jgi:hypothetical protein